MRKLIILLLCCGVLVSMVGCGGNTAPPSMESSPTTVTETTVTEVATERIPPTTAVEQTEKENEPVSTESNAQVTDPTTTSPTATVEPTEETKLTETTKTTVKNTAEEKGASQVEEKVTSETSPKEEPKIESIQGTVPEHDTSQSEFDIQYWISFAKEYAISIGLSLDSAAIDCWDNPIGANSQCIYLERDIKSRLNGYAKDEDITDVWIWTETTDNDCYDIYIGYA